MKRQQDPYNGRYVVDFAYSMGCLDAIGDENSGRMMDELAKECAKNTGARDGLYEQFRLGRRHEKARGAT